MQNEKLNPSRKLWLRTILFLIGVTVLGGVYIFQQFNFAGIFGDLDSSGTFIINRAFRLIINDLACLLIIFALFREKKYLNIAFLVFLVELTIILPVYLVIKLNVEGDTELSSPLLSQVHRLIVNPTLMILLILGFYYQKIIQNKPGV